MIISWTPVIVVDIAGSGVTLVLALWCAALSREWTQKKPEDIFRHYIFLLTLAIVFFAVSRSFGHLVKQVLLLNDMGRIWMQISPYSGAINSTAFVVIFAFGIYFHRFQKVHLEIEKHRLQLELLVAERTAELEEKNVALSSEISDRVSAEKELSTSKITLQNVLDSSIPISITNLDYDLILANKAYYKQWPRGNTSDGTYQKCYASRPGVLCHQDLCPLKQIIAGKQEIVLESKKKVREGVKEFIVTARPFKDEDGLLHGVVESFQDITEWKIAIDEKTTLERQLRQSQKMESIGTLAGGIAHDFNNILTAILGYAQLGEFETSHESSLRAYFHQITKAGDRAKDLVKHILTFSRHSEQEKGPVHIHSLLKEVLKLMRASTPTTIEINEDIDPDCEHIIADPTQIHQVIMNLCTNAVHAMEQKGGVLEVSLKIVSLDQYDLHDEQEMLPGEYVNLAIRDSGHGIPAGILERIFDPYFTTKEIDKGTGLGLSVVHGIVKSHGGKISVVSEVGFGSTFSIFLPSVATEKVYSKIHEEKLPQGKENILLVDDEETVASVQKQLLDSLGYHVTVRTSSVEAYEAFKNQPQKFDLVITDQTMPNMTGVELAKELLLLRPDIPIILCTGFSQSLDEIKVRAHGIRGFAMKPVAISELAALIRQVLDI